MFSTGSAIPPVIPGTSSGQTRHTSPATRHTGDVFRPNAAHEPSTRHTGDVFRPNAAHEPRPPDIPPRLGPWPLAGGSRDNLTGVYFTDRGIEELAARRGEEQVSLEWLAERLRTFVDLHPELETPIERLATWLARLDDDED